MKFEPGPPPKLESTCPVVEPPPAPPTTPPPPAPPTTPPPAEPAKNWLDPPDSGVATTLYVPDPKSFAIAAAPGGIAYFGTGSRILSINLADNTVSDFVGSTASGSADGTGTDASFSSVIHCLAITPDGQTMLVGDHAGHRFAKVDVATKAVTTLTTSLQYPEYDGCDVMPDGSEAIVTHNSHAVKAISMSTGDVRNVAGSSVSGYTDAVGDAARFNRPRGIAIAPGGDFAYVNDADNMKIRRIDLSTNEVITVAQNLPKWGNGIAITPDGSTLICVSLSKMKTVDLTTNNAPPNYPVGDLASSAGGNPTALSVTADGNMVIAADEANGIRAIT